METAKFAAEYEQKNLREQFQEAERQRDTLSKQIVRWRAELSENGNAASVFSNTSGGGVDDHSFLHSTADEKRTAALSRSTQLSAAVDSFSVEKDQLQKRCTFLSLVRNPL